MQQFCAGQASLTGPSRSVNLIVPQVRLFRNHPEVRWRYRVYEQIVEGVRRIGGELCQTDIRIQHPGYSDARIYRRKVERNLRLSRLDLAEHPEEPYILYMVGVFEQQLGDAAGSLEPLRRALRFLKLGSNYGAKLFAMTAQALHRTGHPHEALAVCRAGRERYPDDDELRLQETGLTPEADDADGAEALLRRLLDDREAYPPIVSHDLRTVARHHLAMLRRGQGRMADAERLWREALDESPRFAIGWLELGELLLLMGRWTDLDPVLRRLENHLGRTEDAAVMRARALMMRREFAAARDLLERLIRLVPGSLRPRIALSHVLLFEGRDPDAAEASLREVLRLDPGNAPAMANLRVLGQHRGAASGTAAPPRDRACR